MVFEGKYKELSKAKNSLTSDYLLGKKVIQVPTKRRTTKNVLTLRGARKNNLKDLEEKIGNITIAYTRDRKPIYAKDLNAHGPMTVLLKDAIRPNVTQTLENNPAIIHGGPFANIAQGTNSILATKMGLSLSDYVVTEAGFGFDLGAEKFLDIKCREAGLSPHAVVIVATIRALKYHGGKSLKELNEPDAAAVAGCAAPGPSGTGWAAPSATALRRSAP